MFRTLAKHIFNKDNFTISHQVIKRYAGHSKWQNIKHTKGEKDAQRAQLFTKLGRMMKGAVIEGGSIDPKFNLKLHQVIEQAKRANMPAATVQSILKSCQTDKSQAKVHMFEIKGPGSCFILCEVLTTHIHGLKQSIATILRKHQGKFGDGGGKHLFDEKGIIDATFDSDKPASALLEACTEHAIEVGAEDVKITDENNLQFTCGKTNLNQVVQELEKLGYKISSASVEYIPFQLVNLQDADLDVCKSLYEKLEALPEVVRLSDNIA